VTALLPPCSVKYPQKCQRSQTISNYNQSMLTTDTEITTSVYYDIKLCV